MIPIAFEVVRDTAAVDEVSSRRNNWDAFSQVTVMDDSAIEFGRKIASIRGQQSLRTFAKLCYRDDGSVISPTTLRHVEKGRAPNFDVLRAIANHPDVKKEMSYAELLDLLEPAAGKVKKIFSSQQLAPYARQLPEDEQIKLLVGSLHQVGSMTCRSIVIAIVDSMAGILKTHEGEAGALRLGRLIGEIRADAGLSLRAFAELCTKDDGKPLSASIIRWLEAGVAPNREVLAAIARSPLVAEVYTFASMIQYIEANTFDFLAGQKFFSSNQMSGYVDDLPEIEKKELVIDLLPGFSLEGKKELLNQSLAVITLLPKGRKPINHEN